MENGDRSLLEEARLLLLNRGWVANRDHGDSRPYAIRPDWFELILVTWFLESELSGKPQLFGFVVQADHKGIGLRKGIQK